jgi:CheY-like chemotaxis protein
VKADPGQVDQVLLNLAVNARDAMPCGGRLTLTTAGADLDEAYARAHPGVRPGRYALLAVADTGCGMDEETKARVFEPFFTTKQVGKGTGLGLATVHGIVTQSGGHVAVDSAPGRGTTFRVYLPRVEGALAPSPGSHHGVLPAGEVRGKTILLVEDEDTIRQLNGRILRLSGYTVLEAADGEEALRVWEGYPGPVHLLLTDVVMPRMGGRALAARLAAAHPGLKVLFLSGYTDDAVVRHGVSEAEAAFLQKPFTPAALLHKIGEVLGE